MTQIFELVKHLEFYDGHDKLQYIIETMALSNCCPTLSSTEELNNRTFFRSIDGIKYQLLKFTVSSRGKRNGMLLICYIIKSKPQNLIETLFYYFIVREVNSLKGKVRSEIVTITDWQ